MEETGNVNKLNINTLRLKGKDTITKHLKFYISIHYLSETSQEKKLAVYVQVNEPKKDKKKEKRKEKEKRKTVVGKDEQFVCLLVA